MTRLQLPDPYISYPREAPEWLREAIGGIQRNFDAISLSLPLDGASIADGSITTAKLANGAVTTAKTADGSLTDADIDAANKDGTAATPSMRTLGTGSQQACAGDDARLSDARTPTGTAGGDLSGTYPNPGVAKHSGSTWGVYGVTAVSRPAAYTQNYTTTSRTVNSYTTDAENVAYTGIDNAQAGTVYAQVSDLNSLRTAYENLRAMADNLLDVVTQVVDDLQAQGHLQ